MADPFAGLDDAVGAVLHQKAQDTTTAAKNNLYSAASTSPDKEAGYKHLAQFMNLPTDTVRADPQAVQQQANVQRANSILDGAPHLAQFLTDSDNANIVHDDLPTTAQVEHTVKALPPVPVAAQAPSIGETAGNYGMAAVQGFAGAYNKMATSAGMVAGGVATVYDKAASLITGQQTTAAGDFAFRNFVDPNVANAPAFALRPGASLPESLTHGVSGLLGMLNQIMLTGTGGGAQAAATTTGSFVKGVVEHGTKSMLFPALSDSIDTGRKVYAETGDMDAAGRAAQAQYFTSTLGGLVPLGAPGGVAKRVITGMASGEASGILSHQIMNLGMPGSMQQPAMSVDDHISSALLGGIMGGVMGPRGEPSYHEAIRQTYVEAQKADSAAKTGQMVEALGQVSAASKLRERDPQAFRDFVQKVTEDGHLSDVYVDAKTLDEAFAQSGVTRADLDRTIPEVAQQLHEALQTNGDVRIPVADYATHIAGGPIDQAILQHLKAEPEGMTYKEGQEYQANQADVMKKAADTIAKAKAADDTQQADSQHVYDQVLGQLSEANRFPADVNKAYAAMTRDFYATQAERAGITPKEMLEKYPLNIKAENVAGGHLDQADHRGEHRPPSIENGGAYLHDLTTAFPEDIYSKDAAQFYGTGDAKLDRTTLRILGSLRGKPDADVTVYRAVPKAAGDDIAAGDWITVNKQYAENHGEATLEGDYKIVSKTVKARDLITNADSMHEAGYFPKDGEFRQDAIHTTDTPEFKAWFGESKVTKEDGTPLAVYHGTASDITQFDGRSTYEGGIYFTPDPRYAGGRARIAQGMGHGEAPNVMPAYVKIENPAPSGMSVAEAKALGHDGIIRDNEVVAFSPEQIKSATGNRGTYDPKDPNILHQGQRGAFSPETKTIAILKGADLSTYLHESGHFFLDTIADMAARPDAPEGIKQDMQTLLDHFGVKGSADTTALDEWHRMSLDEQRNGHETFARGFEKYLMEGKAPSVELQSLFSRFRSWLVNVYKSLTALNVELTPQVRGVMDRMLATDEAIKQAEQVRGYAPLFESAEAAGMTPEDFAAYQRTGAEATAQATGELEGKSMKDMRWLAKAKERVIKGVNKEAAEKRAVIRRQATRDVMSQPIRQVETFLTAKTHDWVLGEKPVGESAGVNPEKDNIFQAIAKLGGLDRKEVESQWGLKAKEHPDSGIFGKPLIRKEKGLSFDMMAERLMEEGYLLPDADGRADPAKLEELFHDQLSGVDRYSIRHDMEAAYGEEGRVPVLPKEGAGKLRTSDLKDMLGDGKDEAWRALVKKRMTSNETGLHPDIVAEMFHFENGRDLVSKLLEAKAAKDDIEALTDQRMLERHGELTDPASIERLAEASIHNEARARFIATELKALSKALGPARALAEAAKAAAEAAIAAKRIRDIRPAQYTAAEARAARNAEKALAKADTQAAAVEKRAQLLNNRLAKTATDAVAEINKAVDYLKKFDKPTIRENIELEYRDQIDALLDRHDLRKSVNGAELNKREALLAFVERMAAAGYEPQIPERLLNEAQRQHYKDMSVEDFRGLVDGIKSIEHLGRLKQSLMDGKEARDIKELAAEVKETAGKLPQRDAESNRGLNRIEAKWMSVKSSGRSMAASLLKMEQMMDWLDNRNPNGVLNRVVFRRIADAGVKENDMLAKVKGELDKLMDSHVQDVTKDKGIKYTADGLIDGLTGKPQKFTKKEMLALAGNMGNDSNLAKLAKGEGWDPAQVWAFLHKNMTKADWDFVAGIGRTLESLWPEKLAMSRRLGNTNPPKIAPRPFETPHGRYEGWYWPMIYDPARAQDVAERGAKQADALFENVYTRANTDTGRSTTRNENYARPLLLSLDVIPRVIKDEIHDIAYREAILDTDKFLRDSTVRQSIVSALSQEHYDQLNPWLISIANDGKTSTEGMRAIKFMDGIAHGARTRATIVGLGYRLSTMLTHGSSAAMESVAELGPVWMAKGVADFKNPTQWSANKDFIFERSGEMRNRMNEVDRDVREHLREIDLKLMDTTTGAIARGADIMKAHAYQGIAMLDMASALPTWMGAYHKGMAEAKDGGLGMSEQDAAYFADKTVRNAHGGTGVKDMARVQRGNEFQKLFTMFYTFWSHNVNRIMDTARLAKSLPDTFRNGEPGEFKGDLGTVIMRTLAYTIGVQVMHSVWHTPKKDDGETNWPLWFAKELSLAATSGIPIVRDVAAHYIGGKDYSATPAAGMVGAVGQSGMDVMNAAVGNQPNPKWLKHSITTAGYVFGLPLGQPASAVQFLWDVAHGDQNPETAGDWMRGVMHGVASAH